MVYLRTIFRAIVLVALAVPMAGAQSRVIAAPRGQDRVAFIAPPPATAPAIPSYAPGETVFGSVPMIILPDGRMLVNLGYGYEQVVRTCPYAYGYGCQSYGYPMAPQTPIVGPYAPPQYTAPTYAPPAYPAPQYPAGYQPYYPPPRYDPPAPGSSYGGCPPGYVPTGSYPPCIDPSRSPSEPLTVPVTGPLSASTRTAPARATAATARSGTVVVPRR